MVRSTHDFGRVFAKLIFLGLVGLGSGSSPASHNISIFQPTEFGKSQTLEKKMAMESSSATPHNPALLGSGMMHFVPDSCSYGYFRTPDRQIR